ncbi:hypothetical protein TTHERM_01050640 (macronuclear) [Tetrahymena thermophila SB210]|uniref:Uncharacterized protein n=1 Tax=Tetrahymena thermophila (strain SB210) TaxID=312017 RepID=Q22XJ2_TETTS|nr:hypothetical protein TTHERM_01050640 [Tetrahymena thermophila SB210]EAR90018.2 hypothetical protein TTHERM_01050640 [Tetrahymena thermophila SB210]|eukprot:XP_001010263.2 hypothetical protein TTHERM_01050640 [Tetrahymena thermophila SB210]
MQRLNYQKEGQLRKQGMQHVEDDATAIALHQQINKSSNMYGSANNKSSNQQISIFNNPNIATVKMNEIDEEMKANKDDKGIRESSSHSSGDGSATSKIKSILSSKSHSKDSGGSSKLKSVNIVPQVTVYTIPNGESQESSDQNEQDSQSSESSSNEDSSSYSSNPDDKPQQGENNNQIHVNNIDMVSVNNKNHQIEKSHYSNQQSQIDKNQKNQQDQKSKSQKYLAQSEPEQKDNNSKNNQNNVNNNQYISSNNSKLDSKQHSKTSCSCNIYQTIFSSMGAWLNGQFTLHF